MKKLLLLLSFTIIGFAANSNTVIEDKALLVDCGSYAAGAVQAEMIHYQQFYDPIQYKSAYDWYYEACTNAGGNIQPPIFL